MEHPLRRAGGQRVARVVGARRGDTKRTESVVYAPVDGARMVFSRSLTSGFWRALMTAPEARWGYYDELRGLVLVRPPRR